MDVTTPLCSALDPKQLFIYLKEAETEQQITQKDSHRARILIWSWWEVEPMVGTESSREDAILHALELEKEVKQETSRPRDNYPVTIHKISATTPYNSGTEF